MHNLAVLHYKTPHVICIAWEHKLPVLLLTILQMTNRVGLEVSSHLSTACHLTVKQYINLLVTSYCLLMTRLQIKGLLMLYRTCTHGRRKVQSFHWVPALIPIAPCVLSKHPQILKLRRLITGLNTSASSKKW